MEEFVTFQLDCFKGLKTIVRDGHRVLIFLKDSDSEFLIHKIVFCKEDVKTLRIMIGQQGCSSSFQSRYQGIADIDRLTRSRHVAGNTVL